MAGLLFIIFVAATAAFFYMGGWRGRKFWGLLGGAVVTALILIAPPHSPQSPQSAKTLATAGCEPGYITDAHTGKCTATCDLFKIRSPETDSEESYNLYCEQYKREQTAKFFGGEQGLRRFENSIAETADRQRGLSERDITLRNIERELRRR